MHNLSSVIRECALGLFVWLVGFLTSSWTTRLDRGRIPRLTSGNFTCCQTRDRAGRPRLLSVSAGHIILTPTQPVESGWSQRQFNPRPPHQESRTLPTKLPRPLASGNIPRCQNFYQSSLFETQVQNRCCICILTDVL